MVVFIPKTRRRPMDEPKFHHTISLTSFLMKTMEIMIDQYIRSESSSAIRLHTQQFAYQVGKSTIDELTKKKMAFKKGSLEARNLTASPIWWTQSMLSSRLILNSLGGETTKVTTAKGCAQGGVPSPLLWSPVVDDLIRKLNKSCFGSQGYAHDLVVVVRGKCDKIFSDLMQTVINKTRGVLGRNSAVNLVKRCWLQLPRGENMNFMPKLYGTQLILFSKEAQYLGEIS